MASSATGGHDQEFLDPQAKVGEFECPVCLLVTREPHLSSCCGQHFCQSCITPIFAERKPCPLCKEEIFTILLDKKQRRKVLELKVRCSFKDRGCSWTGKLAELDAHTDKHNGGCLFMDLTCPMNCGEIFQQRHLDLHLTQSCLKRPYTCKYCELEFTYEQVCKHYDKCEKYPIQCLNNCGVQSVERGKMKEHLSGCPLQLLECEFAYAGCREKIRRKDLTRHMQQNAHTHLLWVCTTNRKKIVELEEKVEALQREQAEAIERQVGVVQREKEQEIQLVKAALAGNDRKLAEVITHNQALQREVATLRHSLGAVQMKMPACTLAGTGFQQRKVAATAQPTPPSVALGGLSIASLQTSVIPGGQTVLSTCMTPAARAGHLLQPAVGQLLCQMSTSSVGQTTSPRILTAVGQPRELGMGPPPQTTVEACSFPGCPYPRRVSGERVDDYCTRLCACKDAFRNMHLPGQQPVAVRYHPSQLGHEGQPNHIRR